MPERKDIVDQSKYPAGQAPRANPPAQYPRGFREGAIAERVKRDGPSALADPRAAGKGDR